MDNEEPIFVRPKQDVHAREGKHWWDSSMFVFLCQLRLIFLPDAKKSCGARPKKKKLFACLWKELHINAHCTLLAGITFIGLYSILRIIMCLGRWRHLLIGACSRNILCMCRRALSASWLRSYLNPAHGEQLSAGVAMYPMSPTHISLLGTFHNSA